MNPHLSVVSSLALVAATAGLAATGPSSSETPYLVPLRPGVEFTSLLTVGDAVPKHNPSNPADTLYRMVGIPDGMGAFDNGDGTFTLLLDHEIGSNQGVVRAHGSVGAFVSKWRVRKSDLKVLRGEDLIKKVWLHDDRTDTWSEGTTAFNRFCSADLADVSAYYNVATDKGFFDGRVFLSGEESGPTGRAFAHIATGPLAGQSYQIPGIGNASWENVLASPGSKDNTVLIGLDDTNLGKVFVHVAPKTGGSGLMAGGLHGGQNAAIAVAGMAEESRDNVPANHARFSLVAGDDPAGTRWLRPEDGAWDTQNRHRFYFTTTDRYDQVKDGVGSQVGRSRLWRLTFDDVEKPWLGGTIKAMLDGTEAGQMFDNLTVNSYGHVIIQEDVGGNAHNGKIWSYNPVADALTLLAGHDPARFGDLGVPATAPHNNDEESSGVIEVSRLFAGEKGYDTGRFRYYLLTVQAHSSLTDPELVQRGQLLLMRVPH